MSGQWEGTPSRTGQQCKQCVRCSARDFKVDPIFPNQNIAGNLKLGMVRS